MVKTIHLMKVGDCKLSLHEEYCVESWKRIYPDFEIKIWNTEKIKELASDSETIMRFWDSGIKVLAIDYARLKILNEQGGLYMDTDVFANIRIPDDYFEKDFIARGNATGCRCTNNGTCHYSNGNQQYLTDTIDYYKKGIEKYKLPDNTVMDTILYEYGFKNFLFMEEDYNLENFNIVNWPKFGGYDCDNGYMKDNDAYIVHCRSLSWQSKITYTYIFYFFIDASCTYENSIDDILGYFQYKDKYPNSILTLYIGEFNGVDYKIIRTLEALGHRINKDFIVAPLGNGLLEKDNINLAEDYLFKKVNETRYHIHCNPLRSKI